MTERDRERNRQIDALGEYKARLKVELSEVWARVKWAWNERLAKDEQKPTRKQQSEIDRLSREIENCERSQNALLGVR